MLRDIGRHFSVNRMLAMDSVQAQARARPGDELHRIQLHDPAGLRLCRANQRYDCRLQMGGSDQWGNIVNGIDLGRRMGTPQLHALTTPLITTSSGEKMGKTASGAVWLNADMKSPYEYWQFWRNTDDADVARFLKLFTTLPLERDRAAGGAAGRGDQRSQEGAGRFPRPRCCTAPMPPNVAAETARKTFEEGAIAGNLPTVEIPRGRTRSRHRRAGAVRQGRPRRVEWRGAASDQGRRSARQRYRRHRREEVL